MFENSQTSCIVTEKPLASTYARPNESVAIETPRLAWQSAENTENEPSKSESSSLKLDAPTTAPAIITVVGIVAVSSLAIIANALPWLILKSAIPGLLGIALAMTLSVRPGITSRLLFTWFWCSCSMGAAFHWTPAAMAYTLSSGLTLGTIVAVPLVLWDSLRMALGYWLATKITKDVRYFWFAAAATTIALEYLLPGVFPWSVGQVLLSCPWTLQAVDIFGPSFATFVAFAIAGAFVYGTTLLWLSIKELLTTKRFHSANFRNAARRFVLAPATLTVTAIMLYNSFAWQQWVTRMESSPKIKIEIIQVDPTFKESLTNAQALTASIGGQVDIMCWPESSGGNYELELDNLRDAEQVFQKSRAPGRGMRPWPQPQCELLLAGKNYVGDPYEPEQVFVTAMFIDTEEQIAGRYNKRFLMPFGEYVPGENFVPGLSSLFDMDENVERGAGACAIPSRTGAQLGVMLCYEDMVPRAAREAVTENANVLVSLINGSAFESRFTLHQHRLLSHMRSIECRRYFVRCAATGETCVINPLGEIESRLPMQSNAALISEVGLLEERSIYSRFPWLLPISGCICMVLFLHKRRNPGNDDGQNLLGPSCR